jgi:L-rhamnonate dehydratase
MGGGGGAACYIIENHLRDLLIGADALNVELLWDQMFSSTSFYGRKGVAIQAISGIDLALWDLSGKAAGVPTHKLIGPTVQPRVQAYFTSPKPEVGLKLGFTAFKLPMELPPDNPKPIVDRLVEARRKVGKDARLMIDVLCRWTVPFTIDVAKRIADADVRLDFIEEPILPDDIPGYEQLCREVKSTRIASGEHEYTHYGFNELIRHKAAQILQPDLTWSGGLTTGKRVVELATRAGLPVMPHRGGSAFGMQLIVTSKQCPLAESFGPGESNEMWMRLAAPFEKGFYRGDRRAGHGDSTTARSAETIWAINGFASRWRLRCRFRRRCSSSLRSNLSRSRVRTRMTASPMGARRCPTMCSRKCAVFRWKRFGDRSAAKPVTLTNTKATGRLCTRGRSWWAAW